MGGIIKKPAINFISKHCVLVLFDNLFSQVFTKQERSRRERKKKIRRKKESLKKKLLVYVWSLPWSFFRQK